LVAGRGLGETLGRTLAGGQMSRYDYEASKQISASDYPFYALIMAAMRQADTYNANELRHAWPQVWDELQSRYNAPGGVLETDRA
jgi:hypothetical protein